MRAKTINELQDFERGVDPRAAMGIGGINFNERFNNFSEEWKTSIEKAVLGKSITARMKEFGMDNRGRSWESGIEMTTIKLKEIDISMPQRFSGMDMFFNAYLTSEDGKRYEIDLDQKIFINK